MKEALLHLLPKLSVDSTNIKIIAHQGVRDLERSLSRKLRAWTDPSARFLILRDNDGGTCTSRKAALWQIVVQANRGDRTKVRIVCQELEAWFIGDAEGLRASGILESRLPRRLASCDPDCLPHPAQELGKLRRGYGKITGAQIIAPHLHPQRNRSASFHQTISAIRHLMNA